MTVLELIAKLNTTPEDAIVCVNDNNNGNYFEKVDVDFSADYHEAIIQCNYD